MTPMGKLIDRDKRERAKKQRAVRKRRILTEARSTFARLPFVEVTLDQVGQRADVDRGVTSMYFGSVAELFLAVLKEELESWYDALTDELARCGGGLGQRDLARMLARSIVERGLLARLFSLTAVVLEQNLEPVEVYRFQRWRHDRMSTVGTAMERAGGLGSGDGFRLLYRAQLLTAGLEPASNPRGSAAFDRDDPDLEGMIVDLESELVDFLSGPESRC